MDSQRLPPSRKKVSPNALRCTHPERPLPLVASPESPAVGEGYAFHVALVPLKNPALVLPLVSGVLG